MCCLGVAELNDNTSWCPLATEGPDTEKLPLCHPERILLEGNNKPDFSH